MKKYITTPIYYPSGAPHFGHAYTSVACDVYSRFQRLDGMDAMFLTGTDEHGLKIQRAAEKLEQKPQEYLDNIVGEFKVIKEIMNLTNDDFIRTTEPRHKKTAQEMWKRLNDNGYIYKSAYAGWYSISDETFYNEDELVDGKSPDSGHPVEWVEEESYFFKMSAFQDQLVTIFEKNPELVQPSSRRNEVLSFIKGGLEDVCISRTTFDWGIPVPEDEKHIMYVWVDALTNYLSAIGWPNTEGWQDRWENVIHVVGKDILRFHAIIWPSMLLGAGFEESQLPRVYAHGWWTAEGKKMSKSFGNVVVPSEVVEKYGQDQVRYFMMREISFGSDADFSAERMVERINADLANALGNLFQRVLSMVNKNLEGKVPALGELSAEDKAFLATAKAATPKVREQVEALQFHKALEEIWHVISEANKYMDTNEPWKLKKENPEQMAHVLRVLMESFASLSVLLEPFMPTAAAQFQKQINFEGKTLADIETDGELLQTGTELPKPQGVFMRVVAEEAA